jgi:hypothetical protein
VQLVAGFGVYLILVFVLPGFVYLFVFAISFPRQFRALPEWLPQHAQGDKDLSLGLWLAITAIVGGLLLSSVCFAVEIWLRNLRCFETFFPALPFAKVSAIEIGARAKDTFLPIFLASPIMHFNIAMGLSIILIVYIWVEFHALRLTWIATVALVIVANFFIAHALAVRVNEMARALSAPG